MTTGAAAQGGARDTCVIVVFARAPVPGAVKTRLAPRIGPEAAAALHARLVKHALATARQAWSAALELHVTPDADDPFCRFCAARYDARLIEQAHGDLGARMHAALENVLTEHARALLIGTDCPALTALHLRQADRHLREGADAVFAPCEDGGYALVGVRRPEPRLFEGIVWGGDSVMSETRARLDALGWRWRELDTLWDVDRPADYERLIASRLLETGVRPAS